MYGIAERVARGAAWLDPRYPNWWAKLDISTLDVASCHQCVLGQVYTGCISADEQGQILAQVMGMHSGIELTTMQEAVAEGEWGGFNTLYEHHELLGLSAFLGFSTEWFGPTNVDGVMISAKEEMSLLTDEWTRVIISRRLAAHSAERELVAA